MITVAEMMISLLLVSLAVGVGLSFWEVDNGSKRECMHHMNNNCNINYVSVHV